MSFSSQVTVSSSLVTIRFGYQSFVKAPAVNSRWRYNDSEDQERVPKVYKRRQINESEDEERQDLPVDYENGGCILLPPLKISNCLVNLSEETRSLIYLVSIESKKYQVKY